MGPCSNSAFTKAKATSDCLQRENFGLIDKKTFGSNNFRLETFKNDQTHWRGSDWYFWVQESPLTQSPKERNAPPPPTSKCNAIKGNSHTSPTSQVSRQSSFDYKVLVVRPHKTSLAFIDGPESLFCRGWGWGRAFDWDPGWSILTLSPHTTFNPQN